MQTDRAEAEMVKRGRSGTCTVLKITTRPFCNPVDEFKG